MAEIQIPTAACRDVSTTSRMDHEVISFAVFLVYRAKRMHAPVADALTPHAPTTPSDVTPLQV